jgi:hypothetical protein
MPPRLAARYTTRHPPREQCAASAGQEHDEDDALQGDGDEGTGGAGPFEDVADVPWTHGSASVGGPGYTSVCDVLGLVSVPHPGTSTLKRGRAVSMVDASTTAVSAPLDRLFTGVLEADVVRCALERESVAH